MLRSWCPRVYGVDSMAAKVNKPPAQATVLSSCMTYIGGNICVILGRRTWFRSMLCRASQTRNWCGVNTEASPNSELEGNVFQRIVIGQTWPNNLRALLLSEASCFSFTTTGTCIASNSTASGWHEKRLISGCPYARHREFYKNRPQSRW